MTQWVEAICRLPLAFHSGRASVRTLMEPAKPHIADRDAFLTAVAGWLEKHRELIDAWHGYSVDKRVDVGPFLEHRSGTWQVGFYDAGRQDLTGHADAVEACADFIHREAAQVLSRVRVDVAGTGIHDSGAREHVGE